VGNECYLINAQLKYKKGHQQVQAALGRKSEQLTLRQRLLPLGPRLVLLPLLPVT
jgi:hypothetical protein